MEKETIELVKKMIEDGNLSQEIAEKYCPELKENEDEKIRKVLLNDFKNNCSEYYCEGVNRDMIIAWLEKQGDKKPIISDDALREGIAHFGITQYQIDNWLKKYVGVEKQGEQKPADKVEPKFHEDDWIVNNNSGNIYKVTKIKDDEYCLWPLDGKIMGYLRIIYVDNEYHFWTIKDAKDGDVLAYRGEQWIFIYKERKDETLIKYYALASEKGLTINDVALTVLLSCIVPASKEQRDTLMKAMADAEYTFDFEKKELKKIEQKPAWSKEDDTFIKAIIRDIENTRYISEDAKKVRINWLKSLKERVQPQNLIVTDEELAQAKKDAYNDALDKIEYHSGEPTFDDGWSAAIWYLKKKNAQPQKPLTNEEIEQAKKEYRDVALSKMDYIPEELTYDDGWDDAISYMKKRNEQLQDTWKPSDEQMKALWDSIPENVKEISEREMLLDSLYQDLKKLREE